MRGDNVFVLFDHVRIINTGITGTIVDINGKTYTVESDIAEKDEFGTLYPLYGCEEDEIEHA